MKDEENPPFQQAQDGKDFLGSFAISWYTIHNLGFRWRVATVLTAVVVDGKERQSIWTKRRLDSVLKCNNVLRNTQHHSHQLPPFSHKQMHLIAAAIFPRINNTFGYSASIQRCASSWLTSTPDADTSVDLHHANKEWMLICSVVMSRDSCEDSNPMCCDDPTVA